MKLQIRTGLFETNSSSTHSLTMCMKEDWEAFKRGDKLYDDWECCLVNTEDVTSSDDEYAYNDERYYTYEQFETEIWGNWEENILETFTTPSGEKIVAFGYAGHDW